MQLENRHHSSSSISPIQSAETALHSLIISSEHYVIFDNLTLELILSTIAPENQKEFLAKTIAPLNEQELHLLEVYFSEEMSLAATSETTLSP
mgnify:CR=1 FL=1